MMRKYLLTGATLLLLGVCISSCNKTSPAFNRENIKATWLADTKDGLQIPLKQYQAYTFDDDYGVVIQGIKNMDEGNYKWGSSPSLYYYVYCCSLEMSGTLSGFFDLPVSVSVAFDFDITRQKDSLLIITPSQYYIDQTAVEPGYTDLQMTKLNKNYASADSIRGIWEVTSHDSSPYNEFRLQFDNTGELVYYYKDTEGEWAQRRILDDETDYYNKFSDFLAVTIYDNSTLGTSSKWNVACFSIDSLSSYSGILEITSEELGQYHLEKIE